MNKREAAVLSAFTGTMIGEFSEMHGYIEEILGRPVFTHELASKEVCDQIKEASRADFIHINENIK